MMRWSARILLFVVFATVVINVSANNDDADSFFFDRIISEDKTNLNSNYVYSIAQDNTGLIWFGTLTGLNSYDGYNFKEYDAVKTHVTDLMPVGDSLFVGTERGLVIFNLKTHEVNELFRQDSLLKGKINYIKASFDKRVLIGTQNGIVVYDKTDGTFSHFDINYSSINDSDVRCIDFIQEDSIWLVATTNGLIVYRKHNYTVNVYFHIDGDERTLPDNMITSVCCVDKEHVFVGTPKGLCRFNVDDGTFEQIIVKKRTVEKFRRCSVTDIIPYDDNSILIGTRGEGLFHYNYGTGKATNFTRFDNQESSISDDQILDLFCDGRGVVWISTGGGLNTMERDVSKFYTYFYYANGVRNQAIWSISELTPSEFLFGTNKGLAIFNMESGTFKNFDSYFHLDSDPIGLFRIYSLFKDERNRIWIGTKSNGLYCFDIAKRSMTDVYQKCGLSDYSPYLIREIAVDGLGNVWVATNGGLFRINLDDRDSEIYRHSNNSNSIPSNECFGLLYKDGDLWVTTGEGLARYRYESNDFEAFTVPDALLIDDPLSNNYLYNISDGGDGKFYIGSYSYGIVVFSPENKEFQLYNPDVGVSSSMVYAIIPDDCGNLWASTNRGLTKYDRATGTFTVYGVDDGLQGSDFTLNAALKSSTGIMLFGGLNGFNMFNPNDIKSEVIEPEVVVTSISSSGKKEYSHIHDGDVVALPSSEDSFTIEFSAINLTKHDKVKYRYMLEGYDDDWTERGADRRFAEYHKLPTGYYKFRLTAANEANIWCQVPYELTIRIIPTWYQTWAFRLAVIVLVLVFLSVAVYYRLKYVKEKEKSRRQVEEKNRQVAKLKQKALQLQMNPHVMFNTLNSIQQYILVNDIKSAVHYLSSFAKLMRRVLSNSNEMYVSLFEEIEAIQLYVELEHLRFGGKFDYKINIDPKIDTRNVEIAPMIIQPYVENAILHGLMPKKSNGFLSINFSYEDETILCVVEDNGIGRKKAEELKKEVQTNRKSYGMSITAERMELINAMSGDEYRVKIDDLYDADGKAVGTKVSLYMKIKD